MSNIKSQIERRGEHAAKMFKYYRQFKLSFLHHPIPLKNITAKKIYCKYKAQFDEIAKLSEKYKFDLESYIRYLVNECNVADEHVGKRLLNLLDIKFFLEKQEIKTKRTKVFNYFVKSANNIADECIKLGYTTSKDYIRMLIKDKKLSSYYMSGIISKYYLAALPKFPILVEKLDDISRDEFMPICNKYEKYNIDIKEAMIQELTKVVSVMQYTDDIIYDKRQSAHV